MREVGLCLFGIASGIVISGGVFAFIVIIGIVPRLVQRTKTAKHILLYESVISWGGVIGTLTMLGDHLLTDMGWVEVPIGIGYGVFVGCLAVASAEVLDVIPIMCRRLKVAKSIPWLMLVLAAGKTVGALIYFFVPGFLVLK